MTQILRIAALAALTLTLTPEPASAAQPEIEIVTQRCIVTRAPNGLPRSAAEHIAACTRWLELAADPVSPLYYRAMRYEAAGQSAAALADYEAVIAAGGDMPKAFASRARLSVAAGGDVQAALADMSRAIDLAAETGRPRPSYFLTRALMLAHLAEAAPKGGAERATWLKEAHIDLLQFQWLAQDREGPAVMKQRMVAQKLLAWIAEEQT